MEYTSNYHLPQWVETDRIMMGDFNQMCSDIEAGLNSNAQAAAAAQTAAAAAQQEAEEKGFVVGSYTGNAPSSGTDPGQLIELGFQPRFVIITRGWMTSSSTLANYFLIVGQPRINNQDRVYEIKSNGFLVTNYGSGTLTLNQSGTIYDYVAFR